MSSIIFVSNQISERRKNQINDFEIDINPPIDARSGDKKIILEEIIYPNSLSSIHPRNTELFKFKFIAKFANFIYHKTNRKFIDSSVEINHDWIYIPYGHHTLDDLIMFLNKYFDLIGCKVIRVMGQKCVITCSKIFHCYSVATSAFDGFDSNVKLLKSENRTTTDIDQYKVKIELKFSTGLKHVLGFADDDVVFEFIPSSNKSDDLMEYKGFYVMDPSFGLNFMCVTCDKIVPMKMGYEFKERLVVCPIKLSKSTEDNEMSISFNPRNCVRELKSGIIRSMHFQVKDMNDEKLYFNSGKIVLMCHIT